MITEEWARNVPIRVERIILEACQKGEIDLNPLFRALDEMCGYDPPTQEHARALAPFLGHFRVPELQYLMNRAMRLLEQEAERGVYWAKEKIKTGLKKASQPDTDPEEREITIADIRECSTYERSGILWAAVVLQALVWAIAPPSQDSNWICK
jgi:hypothetical protein